MTKLIYIKTTRARCGYAKAKITRFVNWSIKKYHYSFSFYNTNKYFNSYNELKDYIENGYELINIIDYQEYHLPSNSNEVFN